MTGSSISPASALAVSRAMAWALASRELNLPVEPWKLTSGPGSAADASPLVSALCAAARSLVNSTAAQTSPAIISPEFVFIHHLQTGPGHAAARNRASCAPDEGARTMAQPFSAGKTGRRTGRLCPISAHRVTKRHHPVLVGFDLRQME